MKSTFTIILVIISFALYGQVTSYFVVSDSSGCEPLMVTYTNQSSGSGTLTYFWNFGNGQTSMLEDPWSINYLSDGNYIVSLTVSNGTQTDTYTRNIIVFAKPDAHFTFSGNPDGCLPISLTFTDQSLPGSAPVSQWYWEFGDGGSSVLQNPSYLYYIPGTWNVMLEVSDTNGCSASVIISPVAHVSPVPVIHVTANPSNACVVPTNVQFQNTTSGLSPLTYMWDFGDGGVSNQISPSHTYNQLGVFDVSVTVTDPNGCIRDTTFNNMVNLTQVTASFTTSTGNFTVCPKQWVSFVNTSGNPSSYWYFSTGASSTITNPYMTFFNPGTYQVTLISAPGTVCADTVTHSITVQDFQASIVVDPSSMYSCEVPVTFNYSFNGLPASQFHWIIEDPEALITPVEFYTSDVSYEYTMESPYTYDVTLIAISTFGCIDTASVSIYIDPIVSVPMADVAEGCVPLEVHFSNNSYSHEPIVSWFWDLGYGGGTSTLQNPTYTYDTVGIFTVSLTVVNDSGCSDTKYTYISAGYHHNVSFKICDFLNPAIDSCKFCPMDSIQFDNLTTDSAGNYVDSPGYLYPTFGNQPQWSWFFGSSAFEPDSPIPEYFALTDTGWQYNLFLYCDYLGCIDSVFYDENFPDSIRLYVYGPRIRGLSASMSCDSTYSRTFFADLYDWDYVDWNMGDGTEFLHSTDSIINHTYANTGFYYVSCIAYNDSSGCIFKDSIMVEITDIEAVILPFMGDTICRDSTLLLSSDSSHFNTWNQWTVNNITVSTDSSNFYYYYTPPVFTQSGNYPVVLVVHDTYNCYDTTTINIHVTEPVPSYIADPLTGCAPVNVLFTSTSTSDIGLQSVSWNFGDGSPPGTGFTVNHNYSNSGNYTITILAIDSLGCQASLTVPQGISTGNVNANFNSNDTRCCLGDTLYLNNLSTGNQLNYIWNMGNGTFSYDQHPYVVYGQPGFYDITLSVNDYLGCTDTLSVTDFFEVQFVDASFLISCTDTNCYPFRPVITNTSPSEFLPQCIWDFGDGFTSYNYLPSHTYTVPGNYWLSLAISSSEGCTDIDSTFIHIGGPFANIAISDTLICAGDIVDFSLTDTLNLISVNWNFGDGSGSSLYGTSHKYDYVPPGNNFLVSLIYCSEPTCCLPAEQDTVGVFEVIAGFGIVDAFTLMPDTAHCPPVTLTFPDSSTGATSWWWDLGNGQTYIGNYPTDIIYSNPDSSPEVITITQIINNDMGCTDTVSQNILIWGTPPISLNIDTLICLGDTATLSASGGTSISWNPGTGLSDTTGYLITAHPDQSTQYIAIVTDTTGCTNRDSVWIFVQQIPGLFHSNDTSIIIGETVALFAESDQNNTTVLWNPSDWINCSDCPYPSSKPLENVTYTIVLNDSLGCFEITGTVFIEVIEAYTLDMPVVFTPNGDGANDRVFVRGWGIRQLLEFSVYNRWGERVYYSDDLYEGWDGTFNGKPQSIDTYTYYVKVINYSENILEKKGNITLLR